MGGCLTSARYRDKEEVVGVFVHFRAPLHWDFRYELYGKNTVRMRQYEKNEVKYRAGMDCYVLSITFHSLLAVLEPSVGILRS
jgi:hypothetical protein